MSSPITNRHGVMNSTCRLDVIMPRCSDGNRLHDFHARAR
jgi:hypothetical protein